MVGSRGQRVAERRQRLPPAVPGFLSISRAADLLGVRPRSVLELIERGRLSSQRLGRVHFIPTGEVERWRRERGERERRRGLAQPLGL